MANLQEENLPTDSGSPSDVIEDDSEPNTEDMMFEQSTTENDDEDGDEDEEEEEEEEEESETETEDDGLGGNPIQETAHHRL